MMKNSPKRGGWSVCRTYGASGTGTWKFFNKSTEEVFSATEKWKSRTQGIEKPWLCWNMNDEWCLIQQKLAREVGWAPVVGWDQNCGVGEPQLIPGAVAVDFNEVLQLPVLFMHIPIEFAFLWTDKLAFWHADLLLRRDKMRKVADIFESLKDGELAAVFCYGGLSNIFKFRSYRYWELLGCTTKGASEDQFKNGCGWWRHITYHINCPNDPKEQKRRSLYYYDHGVGIRYWEKYYGGKVRKISARFVKEGHFSQIGNPTYRRGNSKAEEMAINFDLRKITCDLGIGDLL
jgi:hypothetical protein